MVEFDPVREKENFDEGMKRLAHLINPPTCRHCGGKIRWSAFSQQYHHDDAVEAGRINTSHICADGKHEGEP